MRCLSLPEWVSLLAFTLLWVAPVAIPAQTTPGSTHPSVVETLMRDVQEVRAKLVSLATAIPESEWNWRPGQGVRSVEEVLRHVAHDSYCLPTSAGVAAPAATGITEDYETALEYGEREFTRDGLLETVDASLGQLIAYAWVLGVVPPWNSGG